MAGLIAATTAPLGGPPAAAVAIRAGADAPLLALLSDLARLCSVESCAVASTLPAGGLAVCRSTSPWRVEDEELSLAWRALRDGAAAGARRSAVRVDGPVFGGYAGVVMLRGPERSTLSADAAAAVRAAFETHLTPRPAVGPRQAVFVKDKPLLPADPEAAFGMSIASGLRQVASTGAADVRSTFIDERGARVAVQVSRPFRIPTLADGPVRFLSLPPRADDWAALSPADVQADAELARLTAAVQFAVAHFRSSPTLADMAATVGLSPFHFHRRFTERFGITPKHLLFDLQLDEAERLLADPTQALAEIARVCGFAHQSHFTSRFKQGTGLTPTAWRRRHRP